MSGELKCPNCKSEYFAIVAKHLANGQMVPNSGRLQCSNCHGVFENLDGELKIIRMRA